MIRSINQQYTKKLMKLKSLIPNLIVEDVKRSQSFYQDKLGFETVLTVPETGVLDFAMLKQGDVTIMLQSIKAHIEALPDFKDEKIGGTIFLYFDVEDIDAIYKKVNSAGAELVVDINTTFYGAKEFTIKDSDGYLLIFAEDQNK